MVSFHSLLVGLSLLGQNSALAKPIPAENLFPTTLGTTWEWKLNIPGRVDPLPMTVEVIAQKPPVENQVVLRYTSNGSAMQEETYVVTATEVARVRSGAGGASVIEPPIPVIKYPMEVGKTWTWAGAITMPAGEGKTTSVRGMADLKVGTLEEVKTDAGTFKAYRVDVKVTVSDGASSQTIINSYYFAPGVGMVKQVVDVVGGQKIDGAIVSYKVK